VNAGAFFYLTQNVAQLQRVFGNELLHA